MPHTVVPMMSQTTFPLPAQKASADDKNDNDWNYTGPKDTTMWPLHFSAASGSRQSPVNLISKMLFMIKRWVTLH